MFNNNSCSYSGAHHEGQAVIKHACAHCFSLTKRFFNHKQSDCYKLTENREKTQKIRKIKKKSFKLEILTVRGTGIIRINLTILIFAS